MLDFLRSFLLLLTSILFPNKNEPIIPQNFYLTPTVIESNSLPDRHLIQTTFIPQAPEKNWEQPWQDACEEAALLTLHFYYQPEAYQANTLVADYQKIFDFESTQSWTHDVNLDQMAQISKKMWQYQVKIIDNPTLDELKQSLSQNIPIIVPANGKTLFKENKHFKNGGPYYHNLVILGYDDTKKQFIVHDVGTQFGAYFSYSYDTLLASIHDFPASGQKKDINQGRPRVLLLLK